MFEAGISLTIVMFEYVHTPIGFMAKSGILNFEIVSLHNWDQIKLHL